MDPTEPEKPGKIDDPNDPGKIVDPNDPGKIVDPNDPGKIVDPHDPGKIADPNDPGKIVDPNEPGKIVDPNEPGKIVDPGDIVDPIDPPVIFHPNQLIAVATARIRLTEIATNRTSTYVETINETAPENTRFVHLLDGLASLAVYRAQEQVVAVVMHKSETTMAFTLAENGKVDKKTLSYITGLVNDLQLYSKAKDGEKDEIKFQIMKASYIHGRAKIIYRLEKRLWLAALEKVITPNTVNLGLGGIECRDAISSVMKLMEIMALVVTPNHKKPQKEMLTDKDWESFFFQMDGTMNDIRTMPGYYPIITEARCVILSNSLIEKVNFATGSKHEPKHPLTPVPLYRAIQKLSSHHRYLHQLFLYADSPKGKDDLSLVVRVKAAQSTKVVTVMFPDITGVKSIVNQLFPHSNALENEMIEIDKGVKGLFKRTLHEKDSVGFDANIHCECALIASFNIDPPPPMWPFTYIGVSKLSCGPCNLWMKAFNATHHQQYHTRGTHGKWYGGWAMPDTTPYEAMVETLTQSVVDAYTEHASSTVTRKIGLSDSTEAQGTVTDFLFPFEKITRRASETTFDRGKRFKGEPTVGLGSLPFEESKLEE